MMEKFLLKDKKAALLLIDIQEKLAPAIEGFQDMEKPISILIETAKLFNLPIYITEQYPQGLGHTLDFVMRRFKDTPVFLREKTAFNALLPDILTDLQDKQIKTLIIAGIETHVCVYQTVRDLRLNGFEVMLAADAVGSRTAVNKENGLRLMHDLGAVISNTETIVFDLLQDSENPHFKAISRLIK